MVDDYDEQLMYGEEVDGLNRDPVSIREQLISELSVRKKRFSTKSKDLNLKESPKSSELDIEMFEQVSDIVTNNFRMNLMPNSPSKEIILEETKAQPSYSYQKMKPSLTRKIRVPVSGSKLRTEVKQVKKSDLRVGKDEVNMEQMNDQQIRKELFRNTQTKINNMTNDNSR